MNRLSALAFIVLAIPAAAQDSIAARLPRSVKDPGVITTEQRITPAGSQTVFDGRVYGVAFGSSTDELWVMVSGSTGRSPAVYQLAWRDNRVAGRSIFGGSPGFQGLTLDRETGAPVITWVESIVPPPGSLANTDGAPPV